MRQTLDITKFILLYFSIWTSWNSYIEKYKKKNKYKYIYKVIEKPVKPVRPVQKGDYVKEIDVQNSIRLALNPYAVVFRANVGKVRMSDGRFFDTGLPKGFSDLFGFRKSDGKIFFIEVKNATGRLRKEQEHFIKMMQKHGAIAGVARSAEEAIQLINS